MTRHPILAPLTAVLFLTALAHDADAGARRARTLETGQITCWDNAGTVTTCTNNVQDGGLRRGEPRSYRDDGATVRDLRTALTWEKLSDDGSIHDVDNAYTWGFAFGKIEDLNIDCFAGFCDWRLPNLFELQTLVNLENSEPAVSAPFNTCSSGCSLPTCSCTASEAYWSSSSLAYNPSAAWSVQFTYGVALPSIKTSNSYRVRAVRGGAN